MKTRRDYIAFATGMLTMVLLGSLLSISLAKEETGKTAEQADGEEVGIALFGVEQKAPGARLTTAKGAQIPAVLTYTDGKGERHYYVEAETVAELLDVERGAHYRKELNCIDFGSDCVRDGQGVPLLREVPTGDGESKQQEIWWSSGPRHDFDVTWVMQNGEQIAVSKETEIQVGNVSVSIGSGKGSHQSAGEREDGQWAGKIKETPLKPEYGRTLGMFTEADPAEIDTGSFSGASMRRETLQDEYEVEHTFAFTPQLGNYAAITIENPGKADLQILLGRSYTVGNGLEDYFTGIRVPAGQKIVRAFRIDKSRPLENQLVLRATAMADDTPAQVILTAEQYRFGVKK